MGWLKPAESLLEPKAMWEDAHRDPPPDGPVPEPEEGIVALGHTVHGVRIGAAGAVQISELDLEQRKAMDCRGELVIVDNEFDFVPIALLLGIPLLFKRLPELLPEEELRYETKMYAYKLMTTPGMGLPLTWNQNGAGTKLPPILACRSDGEAFTEMDWSCLCEFHEYLDENHVPQEQLWYTNRAEFKKWVALWVKGKCYDKSLLHPCAFPELFAGFEYRFPLGMQVKAWDLQGKPELNGRVGTVTKYDEKKLRIGVQFAEPYGLLSLKHRNVVHVEGGARERSDRLLKQLEKKGAGRV